MQVCNRKKRRKKIQCVYLVLMPVQQHLSCDAIAIHIDSMHCCHIIRIFIEKKKQSLDAFLVMNTLVFLCMKIFIEFNSFLFK
jgi:hypothetical protein